MTHPLVVIGSLVLLAIAVSGFLAAQALEGRAAAYRPVSGQVVACPAASTERAR